MERPENPENRAGPSDSPSDSLPEHPPGGGTRPVGASSPPHPPGTSPPPAGAPPPPPPPGAPPTGPPPPGPQQQWLQPPYLAPPIQPLGKRDNVLGIIGLCCSITGIGLLVISIGFLWFVSLPLSIAGLVCSLIGRQRADRGEVDGGRGMSQAGFVIGIVGVVLHLLALLVVVLLIGVLLEAANEVDLEDPQRRPGLDRSHLLPHLAAAHHLLG